MRHITSGRAASLAFCVAGLCYISSYLFSDFQGYKNLSLTASLPRHRSGLNFFDSGRHPRKFRDMLTIRNIAISFLLKLSQLRLVHFSQERKAQILFFSRWSFQFRQKSPSMLALFAHYQKFLYFEPAHQVRSEQTDFKIPVGTCFRGMEASLRGSQVQ